MSKYQELKENKRSASNPTEEIKAHHVLRDYERGAAELIERSRDELNKWCERCPSHGATGPNDKKTECLKCETRKLIKEMGAL